jgi:antirestriction protein ArdC
MNDPLWYGFEKYAVGFYEPEAAGYKKKKNYGPKRDVTEDIANDLADKTSEGIGLWTPPVATGGIAPHGVRISYKDRASEDDPWEPKSIGIKPYSGTNEFIPNAYAHIKGWGSPFYMTFNTMKRLGGHLNMCEDESCPKFSPSKPHTHESGIPLVAYRDLKPRKEDYDEGGNLRADAPKRKSLVHHNVFNLDQIQGLDHLKDRFESKLHLPDPIEPHEAFGKIQESVNKNFNNPPKFVESLTADTPNWDPDTNIVTLHARNQGWKSPVTHAFTLAHEVAHATGHPDELNRPEIAQYGRDRHSRAREEIHAHMAAASLLYHHGVPLDHPDVQRELNEYIKGGTGWGTAIKADKSLLLKAAADASKSVKHVMGTKEKSEEAQPEIPWEEVQK